MSLSDLFRSARDACQCSQRGQWAEITPIARPAAQAAPDQQVDPAAGAETSAAEVPGSAARSIDVSHLPPPLPMVRILETLRDLGPGETLLVNHTHRPIHLYAKLDALGCTHETTELSPGKIQVRITRPRMKPA